MNTIERINPTHDAKRRAKEAVDRLPRTWRGWFLAKHPQYDTSKGRRHLSFVVSGHSTDLRIVRLLEAMVIEYEEGKEENGEVA